MRRIVNFPATIEKSIRQIPDVEPMTALTYFVGNVAFQSHFVRRVIILRLFVLAVAALTVAGATSASAATYNLVFPSAANPEIQNSTYGDNGHADLSYRAIDPNAYGDVAAIASLAGWETGYGDMTNALWGTPNPSHGEIRIEARNALETVTIEGWDMGGWVADEAAEWRIFDLAWNLVSSGSGIAPDAGAHLSVASGASAVGGLIFQWGGDAWDVGVNNFRYSVTGDVSQVPLPAGGLLLLTGVGAIALRRRR